MDEDTGGGGILLNCTTQRMNDWFSAKYTSSQRGKQPMGWNVDGIALFPELVEMPKACRLDGQMGSGLEKQLVHYWVGRGNKGCWNLFLAMVYAPTESSLPMPG